MLTIIGTYEELHSALKELAAYLTENGASDDGIFKAKLAVSELVTNAIRHTERGAAKVEWQVKDALCELKITSLPPYVPPKKESKCADVMSESGRGLYLVKELSENCVIAENGMFTIMVKIKD